MIARLIWDNKMCRLDVPPEMGTPRADQLAGSPWDQLVELAGRVCYDSLGKGRDSVAYHQHIREAGHLSVLEHATFTVRLHGGVPASAFLNRPSLWVEYERSGSVGAFWRVTMNLRHASEWEQWGRPDFQPESAILDKIKATAHGLAPLAFPDNAAIIPCLATPETPEEHWLSFYIGGVSRGLTHELVRHGDYTAISQRSTRYCDESESDYAWHPAIHKLDDRDVWRQLEHAREKSQQAYRETVERLVADGNDRKTARGAARGVLGNALATELIFSASLARWRRIIKQRASVHADGEIRLLAESIREQIDAHFPGVV